MAEYNLTFQELPIADLLWIPWIHETVPKRRNRRMGAIGHVELFKDGRHVIAEGALGQKELLGFLPNRG